MPRATANQNRNRRRGRSLRDEPPDHLSPAVSRIELGILAVLMLGGIVLRWAWLSQSAVEHFDEGVYASNLWFAEGGYPARHLYAPPLIPGMIEWSILFLGPSHLGTMLPGLLFGTATVPLLWWVGRNWFGPVAGLSAAALGALSDIHALYTRTALTDVPLCFWMLAAVSAASRAYRSGGVGWSVAAGAFAGLAFLTKYNGWLAVAIAGAGLAAGVGFSRLERAAVVRRIGCLAVMAVVTAVVWSPAYFGLHDHGGYAAVRANHRQYFVGPAGWWDSAVTQWANHRALDGIGGLLSISIASCLPLLMCVAGGGFHGSTHRRLVFATVAAAVLLPLFAAAVGSSTVIGLLAMAGLFAAVRSRAAATPWPAWLAAAWFGGLVVATPLYTPYPRITLPWLMSTWLGAAALAEFCCRRTAPGSDAEPSREPLRRRGLWAATAFAILAGGGIGLMAIPPFASPAWQSRLGMEAASKEIAAAIRSDLSDGTDCVCFVYAEPAAVFHLAATEAGTEDLHLLVRATADVAAAQRDARRIPVAAYLLTGPHAQRDRGFIEAWNQLPDKPALVAEVPVELSLLVRLNSQDPAARDAAESALRLYRFANRESTPPRIRLR